MKLPVVMPEIAEQRYDCHGCTNCCRELVVHITADDRKRIDAGHWAQRLGVAPYVRLGGEWVLNHRPGGGCVFLTDSGKCAIHAEVGPDEKPLACRIYPFTTTRSHGVEHVGLRFDCPSAAASRGGSLGSHRAEINKLIQQWDDEGPGHPIGQSELVPGVFMSDAEHRTAVKRIDGWLKSDLPELERVRGIAHLAFTLSQAKLDRVRDRFEELLSILIQGLPLELAEISDQPPSSRQLALFREWVFAHLEYATFDEMQYGLFKRIRERFAQLGASKAMRRGVGPVPPFDNQGPSPGFEDIERVATFDPQSAEAVRRLWIRYLRMRIASGSAWGAGHGGFDFSTGLSATALALPVAGWIARMLAARGGRTACTLDDWTAAIGRVDRTATRSPVLRGNVARLRLGFVADEAGIDRLLLRYLQIPDVRPAP